MKGTHKMAEQTEQVEQLAQRIWSEWLTLGDIVRIAEQFGYPKNQFGYAAQLDGVKWGDLPENVKDHIREMAEKEIVPDPDDTADRDHQVSGHTVSRVGSAAPERLRRTVARHCMGRQAGAPGSAHQCRRFRLRPPYAARRSDQRPSFDGSESDGQSQA